MFSRPPKKCGIPVPRIFEHTAVYGSKDQYPEGPLPMTLGCFRIPYTEYISRPTNGLHGCITRWTAFPASVSGPMSYMAPCGTRGMTSTPTFAMKAAVNLEKYEILRRDVQLPVCGRYGQSLHPRRVRGLRGSRYLHLGGGAIDMSDVVKAIELVKPRAKGFITYSDKPLPFPSNAGNEKLEKLIGPVCSTALVDGVRKSMEIFMGAKEVYGINISGATK